MFEDGGGLNSNKSKLTRKMNSNKMLFFNLKFKNNRLALQLVLLTGTNSSGFKLSGFDGNTAVPAVVPKGHVFVLKVPVWTMLMFGLIADAKAKEKCWLEYGTRLLMKDYFENADAISLASYLASNQFMLIITQQH